MSLPDSSAPVPATPPSGMANTPEAPTWRRDFALGVLLFGYWLSGIAAEALALRYGWPMYSLPWYVANAGVLLVLLMLVAALAGRWGALPWRLEERVGRWPAILLIVVAIVVLDQVTDALYRAVIH